LNDQLEDAAAATTKAYANLKNLRHMEKGRCTQSPQVALHSDDSLAEKIKEKEKRLSPEIAIMQPIFRFLQLLCENHNSELQVGCYLIDLLKFFGNSGSLSK
jgi:inositol 1,4,5-triphosphate receptor type 1